MPRAEPEPPPLPPEVCGGDGGGDGGGAGATCATLPLKEDRPEAGLLKGRVVSSSPMPAPCFVP